MIPAPTPDDMKRSAERDYQPAFGVRVDVAQAWIRRAVAAENRVAYLQGQLDAVLAGDGREPEPPTDEFDCSQLKPKG